MSRTPRSRIIRRAALAVGAMVGAVAVTGAVAPHRATTAQDAATTSVTLTVYPDSDNGLQIGLPMTVAGGAAAVMELDTGSTGLRIFASAVGTTGLQKTGQAMSVEYGDGTVFEGQLAYAPATVAGIATAGPVAFHLVETVTCAPGIPQCPGQGGMAAYNPGFAGIAGVGLTEHPGAPELVSPFAQLPGNLASGWILDTGGIGSASATLTLGLTEQNRAGFNTVQLASEPGMATFTNGTPVWADRSVTVCYQLGNSSDAAKNIQGCWPTTFDTGAEATHLFPDPSEVPSSFMAGQEYMIDSGTPVSISLANVFSLSYTAGAEESVNTVHVTPTTPPSANTGIQFFFRFAVMYDPVNGLLGFKPLS